MDMSGIYDVIKDIQLIRFICQQKAAKNALKNMNYFLYIRQY